MEDDPNGVRHTVYYPKVIKGSVLVDHLAHEAVEDCQSMKFEFPDEDIITLDNCEEIRPYDRPKQGSDGPCSLMGHLMHLVMESTLYSYLRKVSYSIYC